MEIKEMESMHRAYQRGLLRQLEKLNDALDTKDYAAANEILAELIEDTKADIGE